MLNFIKKYPMSILLGIIALNLFSIAGSLRTSAQLDRMKISCIYWENDISTRKKLANKIGIDLKDFESYFCGDVMK